MVWSTALPWSAAAAAGALVLLAVAAFPGVSGWRRWVELLLLAAALAGVWWMIAGPVWVQDGERMEAGRQVVLVDASRSMQVREADGKPRSDAVAAILAGLPGAEVYSFGNRLRPGLPEAYDDGETDLAGALDALGRRYAGERLRSLVVVTDGVERGGLRRRLLSDPAVLLPTLGGPLTLYQIGVPGTRQDLAVTDIHAGGFAFLRAPFGIDVAVRVVGARRASVPVSLTRDGQPVATANAVIAPEGNGTAHFDVTPDSVGRFLYEASVPLTDGDAVPANNVLDFAVRVVRDRVRVLQVNGSPSWDEKFLRLFLKEDPSVDLVSFFILRTQRDMGSGYVNSELSLIGFPYDRLFSEDLSTFDLVVFQNFDYKPYFDYDAEVLLANVAKYVKDGGALVMMGGDRSFDLGGYGTTPLAEVLPVKLGVQGAATDEAPFRPGLTAAGERHPVTRLLGEPSENLAAWGALVPMDGVNLSLGAADGAATLLEHPTLRGADGRPLPVLTVGSYGKGRSMALMVDSSWRWSFTEAASGQGNQTYLRFWKNAMRWLVGDPEDQPVTVEAGKENVQPGEEAHVRVQVRDVGFSAIAGAAVTVLVSGPEGNTRLEGVTGADGSAVVAVPSAMRGPHRVKVSARGKAGGALGDAQTVYAVTSRDPELDEVDPDAVFLQALATRAGGLYVPPGGTAVPLEDPEAGRKLHDPRETPLGTLPLVPLLTGLAASVSWLLRRQSGLR